MTPLQREELRGGWLGFPRPFEALDYFGTALGAYFIYAGISGRAPRWTFVALGSIMAYIHAQRFFQAPRTGAGLVRLLDSLDVHPAEVVAAVATARAERLARESRRAVAGLERSGR